MKGSKISSTWKVCQEYGFQDNEQSYAQNIQQKVHFCEKLYFHKTSLKYAQFRSKFGNDLFNKPTRNDNYQHLQFRLSFQQICFNRPQNSRNTTWYPHIPPSPKKQIVYFSAKRKKLPSCLNSSLLEHDTKQSMSCTISLTKASS